MTDDPIYHPPGHPIQAVETRLVTAPDGRPAVLLQFPDGYLILPKPEQVEELADMIRDAAVELRAAIASLS